MWVKTFSMFITIETAEIPCSSIFGNMFLLCFISISFRLKNKVLAVRIRQAFNCVFPLAPMDTSQSLGPSYFLSRLPPFDFPPFLDRPFPPHLVHFHQSPVTFILSRTDPGAVRGRVKGMVVIEWVPRTGVRKDAGEIGRKRRKRWQGGWVKEGEVKRGSTRKGGGNGHHRSGAKQPSRKVSLWYIASPATLRRPKPSLIAAILKDSPYLLYFSLCPFRTLSIALTPSILLPLSPGLRPAFTRPPTIENPVRLIRA